MIGTRLKEVCGKDKKFKTLKELAECVGVSSNMLYLTLQSKKSLSLKTLQKLVHNTGVSSNYLLGITSIKNISVFKTNKGIPFKYELNTKFLNPDSNDLVCKIIEDIRELENYHGRKLNNQFRYVDSLKINDGIFNGERLKVVMEATGYTSTSLAIILQCSKNTIDGWINKNGFPNIKNFEKLIIALQCSGDFLLNITNDPNIIWDTEENIINNQGVSKYWTKNIYTLYGEHLKEL